MNLFNGTGTLLQRNLLLMWRNPSSFLGTLVFPLLFLALFSILLSEILNFQGIDVHQFVPATVIVQATIFAAMSSAYYLTEDRQSGMFSRWRSLPMSRLSPLLARAGADLTRIAFSTSVVLAGGYVIGMRFHRGAISAAGFMAVTLIFGLMMVLLCMLIGLYAANGQSAVAMLDIPYVPLLMFSSAFADPSMFPTWLQPLVRNSPITHVIDSLRAITGGGAIAGPVVWSLIWCVGLSALFVVLGLQRLKRTL